MAAADGLATFDWTAQGLFAIAPSSPMGAVAHPPSAKAAISQPSFIQLFIF
jgi:hypothetical protein